MSLDSLSTGAQASRGGGVRGPFLPVCWMALGPGRGCYPKQRHNIED